MSNYGWLKTLLMFVIAFAVQSTIGDWLKILGVGPDFILIFIVSVALRFGAGVGCFWGFLAGFAGCLCAGGMAGRQYHRHDDCGVCRGAARGAFPHAQLASESGRSWACVLCERHVLFPHYGSRKGCRNDFVLDENGAGEHLYGDYWRYFVLPHFGEEVGCITILRRTRLESVGIGTS